MTTLIQAIVSIMFLFGSAWATSAQALPGLPVREFDSISDLRANSVSPDFAAHVAGYYGPLSSPDGGEGIFVAHGTCNNGTGVGVPSDDDGGSLIVDSYTHAGSDKGTCWYRQNVNGDLRQFGATKGSAYDCSGAGIDTCSPADGTSTTPNIFLNAQNAAEAAGLRRLTTSGVQIYLSTAVSLDGDMTLDGGVGSPKVSNHTITSPGTIWTTDTASATALTLGSGAALQNAALMPHWIGQNLYDWYQNSSPHQITYLNQQAILDHMINTAQTGVACTSQNCHIRNAAVCGPGT